MTHWGTVHDWECITVTKRVEEQCVMSEDWLVLPNGSLSIESAGSGDEGIYQCVVHVLDRNQFTWTYLSKRASVRFPSLSRFEVQPQDRDVYRGQAVAFSCILDSQPAAHIEWYHNNKLLDDAFDDSITIFAVSSTLEISNVQPRHEGSYKCVAKNGDKSRTSRDAKLTISPENNVGNQFTEPSFVLEPRGEVLQEGESIVLECLANGWPRPEVRWLKGSQAISADGDRIRRMGSSSLLILKASPSDAGVYTCRASNTQDSVDSSTTIQVKGVELVALDSQAETCQQWQLFAMGFPYSVFLTNREYPLLTQCQMMGGFWRKKTLPLFHFESFSVAPEITRRPKDVVAQETTDVELDCTASGKPGAVVSWYKNGEAIIASEYFVIEGNRLRVLGLVRNDQGVYQCVADNDAGSAQASAQLIVDSAEALQQFYAALRSGNESQWHSDSNTSDTFSLAASDGQPRLPSEPLGVRASAVGSRFVTLAWDPPVQRYGSLLAYHIFYKEHGSTRERMMNSSSTSFTVTPLQPNTAYSFRLVAENEAGMGRSTSQISVTTTKEQAVPGKVKNLRAVALSPETIEVTWEPPSGNGPTAAQYKLFYIRKDPEPNEKETQIVMKKTSYTLHGMDKYVEYVIRVEAEGANGAGLSSEPITVRTLSDLPSMPPTDVRAEAVSSTSIQVQWSPPPPEERNGVITGYRIKYKTKLRGTKGNTLVVDGNDVSYTITGLDPATQYMVRVAAVNQNGSGPNSEWVHVDTPLEDKDEGQVAGPPMSLKVQPSYDSIQLSWLPPRDERVMIRGYLVGWGINIPDVEQVKVAPNLRYYTITGLKPSRDYVISLRAYNVMGNGFPIYETVRTTSIGAAVPPGSGIFDAHEMAGSSPSETPVGVRADAISSSAIRVTWTDPEMDVPYSRQYTVRYSSSAESGGQHRYMNASESEVLVEALRPNTQYEFAVRVNAGRASSPWSMTAVNRTLPAPPSSAPRDLTVVQPANGDPHSLTLNWQPPKYGNGEIEEYLIYYSDRADLPDKDWILDGVKGDRLSITLTNLLPRTTYFFKMQARNVKGYGPLSPVLQYVPGAPPPRLFQSAESSKETLSTSMVLANPLYAAIGVATFLLLVLLVVITAWCVKSKGVKSASAGGYVAGRKSTVDGKGPPDLWINHPHGQHVRGTVLLICSLVVRARFSCLPFLEYISESPTASTNDLKRFENSLSALESPPPRYHTLQDVARGQSLSCSRGGLSAQAAAANASSSSGGSGCALGSWPVPLMLHSMTDESAALSTSNKSERRVVIGRAHPMLATKSTSDADCNGTLTRSYHQSSSSLEGRQRTPQVVYTGAGRHQPVAKIDFSDHGSSYGSSQALQAQTPPPQLPNQGPPVAPPPQIGDGYRTLRSSSGSNPLKSFTQLAGAPPPLSPPQGERIAHVVRPVVVASPNTRLGKPAGVVIGQKSSQVPIGRATAQPRVNVNSIYASYTLAEKAPLSDEKAEVVDTRQLNPSNSTEELNAQMENLDTMIDDLQALQHEFNASA
uniref:Neogenin n=1 Tax=Ascaris lumbricoides TaxID=6252 RepID=A0A0M3HY64_ASCLU